MIPLILSSFLIAGGSSFLGNLQLPAEERLTNHTLLAEKIAAKDVVCRDRWGTPMPPDGKAGYSLIARTNAALIAQSLWIPPVSGSRPENPVPVTPAVTVTPAGTLPAAAPGATGTTKGAAAEIPIPGKAVLR